MKANIFRRNLGILLRLSQQARIFDSKDYEQNRTEQNRTDKKFLFVIFTALFFISYGKAQCIPLGTEFNESVVQSLLNQGYDEVWFNGIPVQGLYQNKKIFVFSDITIKHSTTIDNCELVFQEGASLILNQLHADQPPNSPFTAPLKTLILTIQNNSILRGCEKMWAGIKLSISRNMLGTATWNVSNTYFNMYNSTIKDAEIGIESKDKIPEIISAKYQNETMVDIVESTFLNNYIGMKGNFYSNYNIENNTFDYDGFLPNYVGQLNYGSTSLAGIINDNGSININKRNYFKNLDFGLMLANQVLKNSLRVNYCIFENISNTGVQVENFNSLNMIQNNFMNSVNGISIKSNKLNPRLTLIGNVINNASNIGIDVNNLINSKITFTGNTINNAHVGIMFDKIGFENFIMRFNIINNSYNGVKLSEVLPTSNKTTNFYNNNLINNSTGFYIFNSKNNNLNNNIITGNAISRSIGLLIQNNSSENYLLSNTVDNVGSNAKNVLADMASSNNFCCNILNNGLFNVKGTNSNTQIRNTRFVLSNSLFESSAIGIQNHNGNRWLSTSSSELKPSNIFQNNLFIVNNSESNATNGAIRPSVIIPSIINNLWFRNDNIGSSKNCAQVLNCGFTLPPISVEPPSEPDELVPADEPCYPLDLDTDGDGICDGVDPDPDNACIPIALDTDGDGLCDSVDPDPLDGCIPYSSDKDGDGICDIVDPDPLDPCVPLAQDTDHDGLCDQLDPISTDANIPSYWQPIQSSDYEVNIDAEINTVAPQLSEISKINQLETSTSFTFGTSMKEEINGWETKLSVMKYLIKNPYYKKVSMSLLNFYTNSSNAIFKEFAKAEIEFENRRKVKNSDLVVFDNFQARLDRLYLLHRLYNKDTLVDLVILSKISNKIELLRSYLKAIETSYTQSLSSKYNNVATLISNLSSSSQYQSYRKTMWLLTLTLERYGRNAIASDIPIMIEIAMKCPLEYGNAVFDAQEMLISLGLKTSGDFESNCDISEYRSLQNSSRLPIVVFPNPSASKFVLSAVDVENITLSNISGEIIPIAKYNKSINDYNVELSLEGLPNGIYLAEVSRKSGDKEVVKLIKIE